MPAPVKTSARTARTRPTRAETRERVLAAATSVFEELGYDAASVDRVAAAAGLTKGAIYSSFGGKRDLFAAVTRRQVDRRLEQVLAGVGSADDVDGLAEAAGAAMTRATLEEPEWHLTFVEFWARAVRDPELRVTLAQDRREARAQVARLLQEHADRLGLDLPLPPDRLAIAVLAMSNGLAVEHLVDPAAADTALLGDLLRLLLRAP